MNNLFISSKKFIVIASTVFLLALSSSIQAATPITVSGLNASNVISYLSANHLQSITAITGRMVADNVSKLNVFAVVAAPEPETYLLLGSFLGLTLLVKGIRKAKNEIKGD